MCYMLSGPSRFGCVWYFLVYLPMVVLLGHITTIYKYYFDKIQSPVARQNQVKAVVVVSTVLIRLQADLGYKPRPQTSHAKN